MHIEKHIVPTCTLQCVYLVTRAHTEEYRAVYIQTSGYYLSNILRG